MSSSKNKKNNYAKIKEGFKKNRTLNKIKKIEQITAGKKKAKRDGDKDFDPLFSINNTFARMRHDMNRLARKTWSTTKAIHGLENHIWLYIAWNNKYKIK